MLPRALKTLKAENQVKVTSNVYSGGELVLLNWLNEQYEDNRSRIWHEGRAPPRWVVNFDYDLMDGLVLGSVFASYCPFITNHLRQMHPDPASSEECLHNGHSGVKFFTFFFSVQKRRKMKVRYFSTKCRLSTYVLEMRKWLGSHSDIVLYNQTWIIMILI